MQELFFNMDEYRYKMLEFQEPPPQLLEDVLEAAETTERELSAIEVPECMDRLKQNLEMLVFDMVKAISFVQSGNDFYYARFMNAAESNANLWARELNRLESCFPNSKP